MNKKQLKYFKEILERQLETLLAQSGHTLSELASQNSCEIESLDQVSVYTDQVMKLRIKTRESYLIKKVINALDRIENKTFGICESCGNDIPLKRLMARPVTNKCIECKTKEESFEKVLGI